MFGPIYPPIFLPCLFLGLWRLLEGRAVRNSRVQFQTEAVRAHTVLFLKTSWVDICATAMVHSTLVGVQH
eukprot:49203-Amphidinium_carterae.1